MFNNRLIIAKNKSSGKAKNQVIKIQREKCKFGRTDKIKMETKGKNSKYKRKQKRKYKEYKQQKIKRKKTQVYKPYQKYNIYEQL